MITPMKLVACVSAVVAMLLSAEDASAQERVSFNFNSKTIREGLPVPWQFNRWSPLVGIGSFEATARVEKQGGQNVLYLKSVASGFLVGAKRQVDVSRTPWASWRWKAETLPRGGNFKQRSTNDQALQLLFGFEGGNILGYIWDSTGTVGASGSGLAFREDVRVVVLQAGQAKVGQWVTERRNLIDDYRRLFKEAPGRFEGVGIQSNSQHTDSTGSGWVGEITLTKN
jgi:hypothetical protein